MNLCTDGQIFCILSKFPISGSLFIGFLFLLCGAFMGYGFCYSKIILGITGLLGVLVLAGTLYLLLPP